MSLAMNRLQRKASVSVQSLTGGNAGCLLGLLQCGHPPNGSGWFVGIHIASAPSPKSIYCRLKRTMNLNRDTVCVAPVWTVAEGAPLRH